MSASEQPEHASNGPDVEESVGEADPQVEPSAATDATESVMEAEPAAIDDVDDVDDVAGSNAAEEKAGTDDLDVEDSAGPSRLFWVGLLAGMVALYLVVTFTDVWLTSRHEYESPVDFEGQRAAVVLGAAQYNGEPSPVLRARLDEAADLYETGEVDIIVVTGGGQEADFTTEAKSGYDYLRETSGIPDERLLLEVQGASTYESLAATARFLTPEGVTDVVLVTDRYHAKRSILTAKEVGLRPVVSLTPQDPSFERLVEESFGVALGRVITFRRLDRL